MYDVEAIQNKLLSLQPDLMPPSFRFPISASQNDIWTTLAVDNNPGDPGNAIGNRGMHWLDVIGRLKPGVTRSQADENIKAIVASLAKQHPHTSTNHSSARVQSELTAVLGPTGSLLKIVLSAVLIVLLIACENIANLLLARVRDRKRELSMRAAVNEL